MANPTTNVFISWSGARSRAIARSLHQFLQGVLQVPEYFMSDSDISAGMRWSDEITSRLSTANFGILCLTPENVGNEWVLFEAGALSKVEGSRVVPLLYDMELSDLRQPLASLQGTRLTKDGVREMINSIASQVESPPQSGVLDIIFDAAWPSFADELKQLPTKDEAAEEKRKPEDMIREVLDTVRTLKARQSRRVVGPEADRRSQSARQFALLESEPAFAGLGHVLDNLIESAFETAFSENSRRELSVFTKAYAHQLLQRYTITKAAQSIGEILITVIGEATYCENDSDREILETLYGVDFISEILRPMDE